MPWKFGVVVHHPNVRKLCPKRYPGHPKGCPNYGKRATCPPKAPLLMDIQSIEAPTAIIWNRFELGLHTERMRKKRPKSSAAQQACCLYWQGTARKALKAEIEAFKHENPGYEVTRCPEAMGVDVTATMGGLNVRLEWPPLNYAYQVAVGFVRAQVE